MLPLSGRQRRVGRILLIVTIALVSIAISTHSLSELAQKTPEESRKRLEKAAETFRKLGAKRDLEKPQALSSSLANYPQRLSSSRVFRHLDADLVN